MHNLKQLIEDCSDRRLVAIVTLIAFAIRMYLVLTSFCIAADGIAYVAMARDFAAGENAKALASVFSPLYPWLISIVHHVVPDWELAGDLISLVLGTATVPLLYGLINEVYGRRDFAVGAAALAAVHPEMAAYSASVRTEAGFVCLMVGAVYLLAVALKRQRVAVAVAAGALAGAAYLYRTEAVGLAIIAVAFILVGARWWRQWRLGRGALIAGGFAAAFLLLASPYLVYLRLATGHWSVGRELTAAVTFGMADMASNKSAWRALAWSDRTSAFAPMLADPRTYLEKVARDFVMSFYYFTQAIGPVVMLLLAVGLGARRKHVAASWGEALLALLIAFYFTGFALSYTGPRLMLHIVPYSFGWVMAGFFAISGWLQAIRMPRGFTIHAGIIAAVLALVLIPRTLWPLGYDMRGVRYAAADIRRRGQPPPAIVASDSRLAFYAGADPILLPALDGSSLCGWLLSQPHAGYLMLTRRDQESLGDLRRSPCLTFLKRYPRTGRGYYDLFEIDHSSSRGSRGAAPSAPAPAS